MIEATGKNKYYGTPSSDKERSTSTEIEQLPSDAMREIFKWFSDVELRSVQLVNRYWRQLSSPIALEKRRSELLATLKEFLSDCAYCPVGDDLAVGKLLVDYAKKADLDKSVLGCIRLLYMHYHNHPDVEAQKLAELLVRVFAPQPESAPNLDDTENVVLCFFLGRAMRAFGTGDMSKIEFSSLLKQLFSVGFTPDRKTMHLLTSCRERNMVPVDEGPEKKSQWSVDKEFFHEIVKLLIDKAPEDEKEEMKKIVREASELWGWASNVAGPRQQWCCIS